MKRLSVLAVALTFSIAAAACSDDPPAGPSGDDNPNEIRFVADLFPGNEVPPITNADSTGRGSMTLIMTVTRDGGGQITSATGNFTVPLNSFPPGTTLNNAHIHTGTVGVNGGFVVNLTIGAGEFVLANGSTTVTRNNVSITPEVAQVLISNPTGHYFNVHTTLNPGGAVRGQLSRTQ
jgi:hypothetical protein